MSSGEVPVQQPYYAPDFAALSEAVSRGLSIHDMPPAATATLAAAGMYTTTSPEHPGSLRDFLLDQKQQRAHATIARRLEETFAGTDEFADAVHAGTLGSSLAEAFEAVRAIRGHGVRVRNPRHADGRVVDGTVTADAMSYVLPGSEAVQPLGIAWQGLLRSVHRFHPVYMDLGGDGREPMVTIEGLSEHHIRSVGRSVGALVALEDRSKGVVLPRRKVSLARWLEMGETFPPDILDRLVAADLTYRRLEKSADYPGYPHVHPVDREHEHLLGTDAAAAFQGTRDIMNGLIWKIRGPHRNQEQDPDAEARLLMEVGITLKRDPVQEAETYYGPPSSRAPTTIEALVTHGKLLFERKLVKLKDIYETALELGAKFFSGLPDLAISVLKFLPNTVPLARQHHAGYRAWRAQERAAIAIDCEIARYSASHDRGANPLPLDADD